MNEYHYAKLLQIVGLVIGTGVASILLNSEVVGAFAEKRLSKISRILNEIFAVGRYSIAQRLLMPKEGFPVKLKLQLIVSVLVFVAWVLLIVALVFHHGLLVRFSALFLGSVALWMTIDVLLLPIANRPHKYTFGLIIFLLIMRLINVLILFPVIETVLLFSIRVAYLFFILLKSVAKVNLYRFIFTLLGFILVIAGLIWEYWLID